MRLRTLALALSLILGVTGAVEAAAKNPTVQRVKHQKVRKTKVKQTRASKVKPHKTRKIKHSNS